MILIVIFTPLQFINALQFIDKHDEPCKLVVLTDSRTNINQIKEIDKNNICHFPFGSMTSLEKNLMWFLKLSYASTFSIGSYSKIVIGNFNNIVGYFLGLKFHRNGKKVVLIDDGLATFRIYTSRNIQKELTNDFLFGGVAVNLLKKLFGISNKEVVSNLTFFTSYELNSIAPPTSDQVEMFMLNSEINNADLIDKDVVWFIGSPLVKLRIIEYELFSKILMEVNKALGQSGKKLKYVLHRSENPYKDLDIDFIRFDKPLEEIFLNPDGNLPGTVISFYSTALLNLVSFAKHTTCYYIDITKYPHKPITDIKQVYDYFRTVPDLKEYEIK
ncbi:polysialyltransferase family glycosyltransferase [Pedobacter psychroterrae]|uniref:Uncharacterized protein n=1 Tax=Pedobacter psychroterrae TaxID=2530453 RepID=A0A4R0NP15_9SPHI|nr:polysialyltransferase family glycosyltransferase [Pedobacter psychroterrae]TCD02702.1 hypothetical protein EZ437_01560 [Pedobacter psychroterrae]